MMIDDNEIDQMMYRRVMKRSDMVDEVIGFLWARDALDYLLDPDNPPVDLILLDVNMPRMDGFEFLQAASEAVGPDFAPVVVMLTTSLNPRDYDRAMQFDAVREFLNKPLCLEHLAHLAALIGRGVPKDQDKPTACT
ncbi:response regulator [Sulfitobacter sp. JB4-11]|uniref:response regulator n=1 Tax=Sulfitobacter rhodophyticola TaxID=3238304 RepID=UPI003517F48C